MTRDAAAQAVHERLEHLVATLPEPDVEAGWATLVTQLQPPVAPVVPLRRPRPHRALVLGIAAAVLIAGSALAMVRRGGDGDRPAQTLPAATAPSHAGSGPRTHQPFSGPPAVHHSDPPAAGDGHRNRTSGPSGGSSSSGDHTTDTHTGTTHHDGAQPSHHDAADDTDHGTGNDGSHDDNGQGNNVQGQDTQGNGNGSSEGSGNQQGSDGGQGSGNRGTGSGGANPNSGAGSNSGQASHGQGQSGGQGSNR